MPTPDLTITGSCQTHRSPFCTGQGFQREDPLQMLSSETAFKYPKIQCLPCYEYSVDAYLRQSHELNL